MKEIKIKEVMVKRVNSSDLRIKAREILDGSQQGYVYVVTRHYKDLAIIIPFDSDKYTEILEKEYKIFKTR